MDFFKDLWPFPKVRRISWLFPLILILILFGAILVFPYGSAVAPFIYTLF